MTTLWKTSTVPFLGAAMTLTLCGSSSVLAQQQGDGERTRRGEEPIRLAAATEPRSSAAEDLKDSWQKMREEVINAEELLGAEIGNGFAPVGEVADLVLNRDGTQVQYILYKTPYPYTLVGGIDGFARYDGVEFRHGVFDVTLLLDAEESAGAPDELSLTRAEARQRLVSWLIGEPMLFTGNDAREIEDILIDKDSGTVLHYVVETEMGSVLDSERRTVPADRVSIDGDGDVVAAIGISALDDVQVYDPSLL